MAARINWEVIRAEYISDAKSTYRSLGEKYGVSFHAISDRSRGENWCEQRRKRSEDVSRQIIDARTKADVEKFTQVSEAAQVLIDQIELALRDKDQFYRYIINASSSDGSEFEEGAEPNGQRNAQKVEHIFSKMDTRALRDITSSLREALEILRRANRIPTVEQEMQYELALKRLELEKERASKGDMGDRMIQITFDDEIASLYGECDN